MAEEGPEVVEFVLLEEGVTYLTILMTPPTRKTMTWRNMIL
jgi:hypothetical protein